MERNTDYIFSPVNFSNFDWNILGFSEQPQVRLVGELDKIQSVFFGERSRYGILITVTGSENYGLRKQFYPYVYPTNKKGIATICMEQD